MSKYVERGAGNFESIKLTNIWNHWLMVLDGQRQVGREQEGQAHQCPCRQGQEFGHKDDWDIEGGQEQGRRHPHCQCGVLTPFPGWNLTHRSGDCQ